MKQQSTKSGSSHSKEEIVDFYIQNYQSLLRYSFSICKNKCISEDVLQDVFLSIYRRKNLSIHKLDQYFTRAVKFSTLKIMKSQTYFSSNDQYVYDFKNSIIKSSNHNDFLAEKIILEEIEKLPERRKLIFKMKRLQRNSTKDVSKRLKISKKTVENHLTLAIRQLKPRLTHLKV